MTICVGQPHPRVIFAQLSCCMGLCRLTKMPTAKFELLPAEGENMWSANSTRNNGLETGAHRVIHMFVVPLIESVKGYNLIAGLKEAYTR